MNLNPESSPQIPDDSANQADAAEFLSLWGYFVKCWKMSAKYGGRARRREFWGFCLSAPIFLLALFFISILATAKADFRLFLSVNLFFIIAMYLPFIAVTVRRLHDIGKSGWWSLPFILFTVTFPLSVCSIFFLIITAGTDISIPWMWSRVYVCTALALMLVGPFIFVWGLLWLCRGSQRSSNKYGDGPLDVF